MAKDTHRQSHGQSSKTGNPATNQAKSAQEIADATAANVSTAERDNTAVGLPVASSMDSEKTASEVAAERAEQRSENVEESDVEADWSGGGTRVSKPDGKILKPGDDIEFEVDDEDTGGLFVKVKKDIYREVHVRNAVRPTYVLLYAAGTMVPRTLLQKVG